MNACNSFSHIFLGVAFRLRRKRYLMFYSMPPLMILLVIFFVGCGKEYEHVRYDAPKLGPKTEITIPNAVPVDSISDITDFEFLEKLPPKRLLVFSGTVVANPEDGIRVEDISGVVFVKITKESTDGKSITANSGAGRLADYPSEKMPYRIELTAPRRPGKYSFEIKCGKAYIGRGSLEVKADD